MSDVFLSYSGKSGKHAEALAAKLTGLGITTWLASKSLSSGEAIEGEILNAIRESRVVVFLIGPTSSAPSSKWVQFEYMAALEHSWSDNEKILLPVLIGDAEAPPFLRHTQALKVEDRNPDWTGTARRIAGFLNGEVAPTRDEASIREQHERLNLIEREANALRVAYDEARKP